MHYLDNVFSNIVILRVGDMCTFVNICDYIVIWINSMVFILYFYIIFFIFHISLQYETICMYIFKPYFVFFDNKPYATIFDFTSNHFHSLELPLNDSVCHHLTCQILVNHFYKNHSTFILTQVAWSSMSSWCI